MKFHNIRMVGPFNNEHLSSLPTFDVTKDQGRMVWLDDGSLWYGDTTRWVKILAGDGGGSTTHNDLDGRSDADCHPISSITGLEEALKYGGLRWMMVSSTTSANFQAEKNTGYFVDTTSGPATATLPPTAALGDTIKIVDYLGNFDSNKVVVDRNGQVIMGLPENMDVDEPYMSATFVYSDASQGWIVSDGKVGGCSGGTGVTSSNFQWNIIDLNTNAQRFNGYFVDTEYTPITITLPSTPSQGDVIKIVDYNGFANTNNITVSANGNLIGGDPNDLVLNINGASVTLIYSDQNEGWVVYNAFRTSDTGGGIIDVDTTIYLAPSAASHAPSGINIGSDITGDGSIDRPFYSVKRAIEYLEGYSIKPGIYVTIRGLSGKYYYTDDHAINIEHKDAKFIKIKYDIFEPGYYHETDITTDPVTVVNNTDHDLITFTVSDIGTGFYQIQAGDYIKIYATSDVFVDKEYAVWQGFYRVTAVDSVNKKITIMFKRHQSSNTYNTRHQYILPSTPLAANKLYIIKLSTHQYINYTFDSNRTEVPYFIKSNFGLGGIKMAASDEYYYNNSNGDRGCSYIQVYDGVINDVKLIGNGFFIISKFKNLELNYEIDTNIDKTFNTFTSCDTPLLFVDVTCEQSTNIVSNCNYNGLFFNNVSYKFKNNLSAFCNNYGYGFNAIGKRTLIYLSIAYTSKSVYIGNDSAIVLYHGVMYTPNIHITDCFRGFFIADNATLRTFNSTNDDLTNIPVSIVENCDYGTFANGSSFMFIKNITFRNCSEKGIYAFYSTYVKIQIKVLVDNCNYNIYIEKFSKCEMYSGVSSINGNIGISSVYNSDMICSGDIKSYNNNYGIYIAYNSKMYYYNGSTSSAVYNNSSKNVYIRYNSSAVFYINADITNMDPVPNTAPSYGNATQGIYILKTVY